MNPTPQNPENPVNPVQKSPCLRASVVSNGATPDPEFLQTLCDEKDALIEGYLDKIHALELRIRALESTINEQANTIARLMGFSDPCSSSPLCLSASVVNPSPLVENHVNPVPKTPDTINTIPHDSLTRDDLSTLHNLLCNEHNYLANHPDRRWETLGGKAYIEHLARLTVFFHRLLESSSQPENLRPSAQSAVPPPLMENHVNPVSSSSPSVVSQPS